MKIIRSLSNSMLIIILPVCPKGSVLIKLVTPGRADCLRLCPYFLFQYLRHVFFNLTGMFLTLSVVRDSHQKKIIFIFFQRSCIFSFFNLLYGSLWRLVPFKFNQKCRFISTFSRNKCQISKSFSCRTLPSIRCTLQHS